MQNNIPLTETCFEILYQETRSTLILDTFIYFICLEIMSVEYIGKRLDGMGLVKFLLSTI